MRPDLSTVRLRALATRDLRRAGVDTLDRLDVGEFYGQQMLRLGTDPSAHRTAATLAPGWAGTLTELVDATLALVPQG